MQPSVPHSRTTWEWVPHSCAPFAHEWDSPILGTSIWGPPFFETTILLCRVPHSRTTLEWAPHSCPPFAHAGDRPTLGTTIWGPPFFHTTILLCRAASTDTRLRCTLTS